jgi:hypothetical protein
MRAELTEKAQRQIEEKWRLQRAAVRLLGLVVAEWKSDPVSVQCFDLRIVEDAKTVIARLEKLRGPFDDY